MSTRSGDTPNPTPQKDLKRSFARLHLWQIQPVRDIAVILLVLWIIGLGYKMSIVTVPLLLGLLLAYLLEPPISWLAKRTSRAFAAGAAIALLGLIFVGPIVGGGIVATTQGARFLESLDDDLPRFIERAERFLSYLERDKVKVVLGAGGKVELQPGDPSPEQAAEEEAAKKAQAPPADGASAPAQQDGAPAATEPSAPANTNAEAPSTEPGANPTAEPAKEQTLLQEYASILRKFIGENFGQLSKQGATGILGVFQFGWTGLVLVGGFAFKYIFLTPFFFFFWSISLGAAQQFGAQLIPEKHREQSLVVIRKMDGAIASFIRGRFTIALILTVCYTLAYWAIGVPAPLVFGPIVGIASAVPYLPLLGWPATMLAMAIDQSGAADPHPWWWIILGPTIVYFAFQTLDDYVLTPAIQGKNVGLSTPVILFAVLGAGALAGVYGVLIAIPIAACIKIFVADVIFPRYKAWVEGKADDPLPLGDRDQDTV
jgi:predicted PurR-regulated permease PerM